MRNKGVTRFAISGLIYLTDMLMFLASISSLWGWHGFGLASLCMMLASFIDKRDVLRQQMRGESSERVLGGYRLILMASALAVNSVYFAALGTRG